MSNVSSEMEVLRKNKKTNARDQKACHRNEVQAFDGLVSRLDATKEGVSELESIQ